MHPEKPRTVKKHVDEMKPHPAVPPVPCLAPTRRQCESLVDSVARSLPLTRARVQPGVRKQGSWEVMAGISLAQNGKCFVQVGSGRVKRGVGGFKNRAEEIHAAQREVVKGDVEKRLPILHICVEAPHSVFRQFIELQ